MGHAASVPNVPAPTPAPVAATPAASVYCGMNITAANVMSQDQNGNINLTSCNSALTVSNANLNTPPPVAAPAAPAPESAS